MQPKCQNCSRKDVFQRFPKGKKSLLGLGRALFKTALSQLPGNKKPKDSYDDLHLSEERKAVLRELYPNGFAQSKMSQQNVGDCYLLASLHGLKSKTIGPYIIADTITKRADRHFKVFFLGTTKGAEVITLDDTQGQTVQKNGIEKRRRAVDGDLGDKVLERAFGRQRKTSNADKTMDVLHGGYAIEPLSLLFGELANFEACAVMAHQNFRDNDLPAGERAEIMDRVLEYFKKISKDPETIIAVADTSLIVSDKSLRANHAYLVSRVNLANQTIVLVNPHNTKDFVQIDLETFFKNFRALEIANLDLKAVELKYGNIQFPQPYLPEKKSLPGKFNSLIKDGEEYIYQADQNDIQIVLGIEDEKHFTCSIEKEVMTVKTPHQEWKILPGETILLDSNLHNVSFRPQDKEVIKIGFLTDGKNIGIKSLCEKGAFAYKLEKGRAQATSSQASTPSKASKGSDKKIANERLQANNIYKFNTDILLLKLGGENNGDAIKIERYLKDNKPALKISHKGQERTLRQGENMTLGRDGGNLGFSNLVSGLHVWISLDPQGNILVKDLESSGGTFVQ